MPFQDSDVDVLLSRAGDADTLRRKFLEAGVSPDNPRLQALVSAAKFKQFSNENPEDPRVKTQEALTATRGQPFATRMQTAESANVPALLAAGKTPYSGEDSNAYVRGISKSQNIIGAVGENLGQSLLNNTDLPVIASHFGMSNPIGISDEERSQIRQERGDITRDINQAGDRASTQRNQEVEANIGNGKLGTVAKKAYELGSGVAELPGQLATLGQGEALQVAGRMQDAGADIHSIPARIRIGGESAAQSISNLLPAAQEVRPLLQTVGKTGLLMAGTSVASDTSRLGGDLASQFSDDEKTKQAISQNTPGIVDIGENALTMGLLGAGIKAASGLKYNKTEPAAKPTPVTPTVDEFGIPTNEPKSPVAPRTIPPEARIVAELEDVEARKLNPESYEQPIQTRRVDEVEQHVNDVADMEAAREQARVEAEQDAMVSHQLERQKAEADAARQKQEIEAERDRVAARDLEREQNQRDIKRSMFDQGGVEPAYPGEPGSTYNPSTREATLARNEALNARRQVQADFESGSINSKEAQTRIKKITSDLSARLNEIESRVNRTAPESVPVQEEAVVNPERETVGDPNADVRRYQQERRRANEFDRAQVPAEKPAPVVEPSHEVPHEPHSETIQALENARRTLAEEHGNGSKIQAVDDAIEALRSKEPEVNPAPVEPEPAPSRSENVVGETPNASEVRSNQGQLPQEGVQPVRSENSSGENLQRNAEEGRQAGNGQDRVEQPREFFRDDITGKVKEITPDIDPKHLEGVKRLSFDQLTPKEQQRVNTRPSGVTRRGATPAILSDDEVTQIRRTTGVALSAVTREILSTIESPAIRDVFNKMMMDKGEITRRMTSTVQSVLKAASDFGAAKFRALNEPDAVACMRDGYARSKAIDLIEGKVAPTAEQLPLLKAIWDANIASLTELKNAGITELSKGFASGKGAVRFITQELRAALTAGDGTMFNNWVKGIADLNNVPEAEVRDFFNSKGNGWDPSHNYTDAAELYRKYKEIPSHVSNGNVPVATIDLDPTAYVRRLRESASTRVALANAIGPNESVSNTLNTPKFKGISKYDANRAKVVMDAFTGSGQLPVGQNPVKFVSDSVHAIMNVSKALLSSGASIPSLTDSLNIQCPINHIAVGAKNVLMGRETASAAGAVEPHRLTQFEHGSFIRRAGNATANAIRSVTAQNIVHDTNMKIAWESGKSWATDMQSNGLTGNDRTWLQANGVPNEVVTRFESGTATAADVDNVAAIVQRKSQPTAQNAVEKSSIENSNLFRKYGPAFTSYPQSVARQTLKAIDTAIDRKDFASAVRLGGQLTRVGAAGLTITALKSLFTGSFSEAKEDPRLLKRIAFEIVTGGGITMNAEHLMSGEQHTLLDWVATMSQHMSIAVNIAKAVKTATNNDMSVGARVAGAAEKLAPTLVRGIENASTYKYGGIPKAVSNFNAIRTELEGQPKTSGGKGTIDTSREREALKDAFMRDDKEAILPILRSLDEKTQGRAETVLKHMLTITGVSDKNHEEYARRIPEDSATRKALMEYDMRIRRYIR